MICWADDDEMFLCAESMAAEWADLYWTLPEIIVNSRGSGGPVISVNAEVRELHQSRVNLEEELGDSGINWTEVDCQSQIPEGILNQLPPTLIAKIKVKYAK